MQPGSVNLGDKIEHQRNKKLSRRPILKKTAFQIIYIYNPLPERWNIVLHTKCGRCLGTSSKENSVRVGGRGKTYRGESRPTLPQSGDEGQPQQ